MNKIVKRQIDNGLPKNTGIETLTPFIKIKNGESTLVDDLPKNFK